MRFSTLALQATLVLGVTATVGYPEFRQPTRPVTVWRTAGPLTPRPDLVGSDTRFAYGVTESASATTSARARERQSAALETAANDRQAIRTAAMAARVRTIAGRARTALNQPVPFANMVLRNIRTGRIEARTRADQNGGFEFDVFIAGGYVIELIGADGATIAASEMGILRTDGETVVRVSTNATPRALFGSVDTSTAGGTTVGTTTGTTSGTTAGGGNTFVMSTASETVGRAADSGAAQTAQPDEEASPRN
jgi:hypothetical protein